MCLKVLPVHGKIQLRGRFTGRNLFNIELARMKKLLLCMLFLAPVILMAQEINNGTIIFDFNKKQKSADSTGWQEPAEETLDSAVTKKHKAKKQTETLPRLKPLENNRPYDYKRDGVFSGLFHAGFNAAQIDGDNEFGYKYFGFEGGVGAMARFHKLFSASLELNYSMLGARARLTPSSTNLEAYQVQLDYIEAPVAINAHYKDILIISIGVAPGYLTRYKEFEYDGINVTGQPNRLGQPRKFGMAGFASMYVVIKGHYAIGGKFSYSMLKVRAALPGEHVNGEYNNYLALDFKYILNRVKKRK
jgi:Outer membrane protein beta-barrel domain